MSAPTTEEILSDELMNGALDRFDLDALTTPQLVMEADRWLSVRIEAVQSEREDELAYPLDQRDADWLGASRAVLKRARHLLHHVRLKEAAFRKLEAAAENATAERAFVDLMRERLPREDWLAAWEEVRSRHPELARAA